MDLWDYMIKIIHSKGANGIVGLKGSLKETCNVIYLRLGFIRCHENKRRDIFAKLELKLP